jgi:hypothetical protein
MSLLGRSFTRGFGSYLGAFTAKALVSSATSRSSSVSDGKGHRFFLGLLFYVISCALSIKYINMDSGIPGAIILFGWIIPVLFFKIRDVIGSRKTRAYAKSELMKVLDESEAAGIEASNREELLNKMDKTEYPMLLLLEAKEKIERVICLHKKYGKNDLETMNKILDGKYWVGMSEDHLKDMLPGQTPSSQERKEIKGREVKKYVYGKNSYSGDTLVFTDGILTEFKDKDNFINQSFGSNAVAV